MFFFSVGHSLDHMLPLRMVNAHGLKSLGLDLYLYIGILIYLHTNVTVTYGNCPSYTRNDSSHLTGPWLVMVGGDRHIKNAMGVCI